MVTVLLVALTGFVIGHEVGRPREPVRYPDRWLLPEGRR